MGTLGTINDILEEMTDAESCPSCGEDWPWRGGEHTEDCRWNELRSLVAKLLHPAAAEQPAPTGEGCDVILDLVKAIRRGKDPRLSTLVGYRDAIGACKIHKWDLCEALLARREKGIEKYGTPLRTHNGRDAKVDRSQELLDAFIYDWQIELESAPR